MWPQSLSSGHRPQASETEAAVEVKKQAHFRVSTPASWGHNQVPARACPSSWPPVQLSLIFPFSLAETDALGHDVPPAAVCPGAACVTEPLLPQLFHVSVRHRPTPVPPGEEVWALGGERCWWGRSSRVVVTEGRPQVSLVGTRFVLSGCPQSLSRPPLNPFCPDLLGPGREHGDLFLLSPGSC